MRDDRLEAVLRRTLRPDPERSTRVADAALGEQGRHRGPALVLRSVAAVAVVLLVVVVIITLRPGPPPSSRAVAIFSVGDLVVGVVPDRGPWIVNGSTSSDPGRVSITVLKGDRQ